MASALWTATRSSATCTAGSRAVGERGWHDVIVHLDRTDYISQFNNELCYLLALEKMLGVEAPERAQYARIILSELNRIVSHMMFYGAFGADVGAITPFLYAFRERERLQRLFESVSGARLMHFYFRAGGLKEDLPPALRPKYGHVADHHRRH